MESEIQEKTVWRLRLMRASSSKSTCELEVRRRILFSSCMEDTSIPWVQFRPLCASKRPSSLEEERTETYICIELISTACTFSVFLTTGRRIGMHQSANRIVPSVFSISIKFLSIRSSARALTWFTRLFMPGCRLEDTVATSSCVSTCSTTLRYSMIRSQMSNTFLISDSSHTSSRVLTPDRIPVGDINQLIT